MVMKRGFSLLEVNMAVFVLAVGVLSIAALYPLGLREGMRASSEMLEAALADDLLNQAVALASQPTVSWNKWNDARKNPIIPYDGSGGGGVATVDYFTRQDSFNDLPDFLKNGMKMPDLVADNDDDKLGIRHFRIACCRPPAHSGRVMGIMVQSTVNDDGGDRNSYSNNTIYYAEAYFQGEVN